MIRSAIERGGTEITLTTLVIGLPVGCLDLRRRMTCIIWRTAFIPMGVGGAADASSFLGVESVMAEVEVWGETRWDHIHLCRLLLRHQILMR